MFDSEEKSLEFTNHYSNYNKEKAWSAISLRGYSPDWRFITKPVEMNKKWQEEHKDEKFELQDTELRKDQIGKKPMCVLQQASQ
mgnify:CR=1 FL=1